MKTQVFELTESLARGAAQFIIDAANRASQEKGLFTMAVSGGATPRRMLEILSETDDVPWEQVHLFQVDERVAPNAHQDRNSTMLSASLMTQEFRNHNRLAGFWLMPVETEDLDAAARKYETQMGHITGLPISLDLIQLGLGDDGHTASLPPGDPILECTDRDVQVTGEYRGRRRMTFTRPIIQRAAQQLWLVSGENKREAVDKLLSTDPSIPATRVLGADATLMLDRDAVPENLEL